MPIPGGNKSTSHPLWGSETDNTVASQGQGVIRKDSDSSFSIAQIINQGGSAEGSNIPPQQRGAYRTPIAQNFKVLSSTYNPATLNTTFVLVWSDIIDQANGLNQTQVAKYHVYAQLTSIANSEPTLVGSSSMSPCYALVSSPQVAASVTFWLQPSLTSGQTLPLSACPTCTGTTVTPFFAKDAIDPVTGLDARVTINSGLPWAGGTTVGLGITYPLAGAPQNTYYATYSGVGFEAFAGGGTIEVNGTGIEGTKNPNDGKPLYEITPRDTGGGALVGVFLLQDGTGTGGIDGHGARVYADGGLGQFVLYNGANTFTLTAITAATATTGAATLPANPVGFVEIGLNGTVYKIPYYNT